jgi:uncharacterized Zn finger protein
VNSVILDDGRPVLVSTQHDRIGRGPWARLLATSVVPDEGSARAERGRTLARSGYVHTVAVAEGVVSARVIGSGGAEYDVRLSTEPVPPRVWAAVSGSPRGSRLIEAAVRGSGQSSVHLQHELLVDWDVSLVPPAHAVRRSCTCPDSGYSGACKHVIALAYVLADAIDRDPALLLRWRGCESGAAGASTTVSEPGATASPRVEIDADAWQVGPLPEPRPPRALPVGAVLKRLGTSGVRVGNADLADVLRPAYAAFAVPRRGTTDD